jgi:hypothetical protein
MRTIDLAGLLGLLLFAQQALAEEKHPEHDAVMKVVDSFFLAINTSDAALMKKIALHDSMTYSVREQDDGRWTLRARPQTHDFDPANWGPEKLTERYWAPTVLITDHIAVFWAPYDFYIDGGFSHCGTDAVDLVKVDGDWKIGNSSWTVQKTGCVMHPDGPPAEAKKR